ncbi:diacylglycerol/lipid kinase family protein [Corynebacterium sp. H113]|uniref:diacylglycerol/lipid kinase family protein n=1 Tax=Corynebacterium sp. H113 TaxID=3133419 RepID=UPI0030A2D849
MRALIISNPNSTSITDDLVRCVVRSLRAVPGLRFHTEYTSHPGHATELTRGMTAKDVDYIVCLGGDGTVNEVVNGLMDDATPTAEGIPPHQLPAIVIIPTGSANVLAGALDIPRNPFDAARLTTRLLRKGEMRTISAGYAKFGESARWFVVNAGAGLDADVIASVEAVRSDGKSAKPIRYVRTILPMWNQIRLDPPQIRAEVDGVEMGTNLPIAVVSNSNPWTFLGDLPVVTNPNTDMGGGLGFFGVRSLAGLGGIVIAANLGGALLPLRRPLHVQEREIREDNAAEVVLESARPLKFQLDGEYIDEVSAIRIAVSSNAIKVVAPVDKRHPTGFVKSVTDKPISVRLTAMLQSRLIARLRLAFSRD